ncbi:MAG: peptide chain release factor 3 [Bacteroidales bacterium]|jgi:peptide chain release factor 3|nr:peptide chain release factor 3 [Bacteroidales bacterium]MCU0407464.1 peptide chain release factor 3 [Bacteroidales bacterium]
MELRDEIRKRRTFAIISHPDAGKTTLTEKLLLFGGAIQTAGAVRSNKIRKSTTSDFMEIEKQRGISVSTSVMAFDYNGIRVNILDTPGHKDFAEDTYRTLTAVDSVILVVDSVKGVEEQTRKLMEVCRMRNTPVMVFINKMDREGIPPVDLLDELERELSIAVCPYTWPLGSGRKFGGVYNIQKKEVQIFAPDKTEVSESLLSTKDIHDPRLEEHVGIENLTKLWEDVEFVNEMYEPFNLPLYREGYLAPLFFGSALNNFGVLELLETFLGIAPCPGNVKASGRVVEPAEAKLTGFVFKIHANLDPNHRDRIAFMRICSGRFERNKFYYHVRSGKKLRFTSPASFMANSKSIVEEAFPGDVVGLYDNGNFKIGDTLTEGEDLHFEGIPSFSPEILKEVVNLDPMKTKQLEKGVRQMTDEGVAQLFVQQPGNRKIIGTVGELQYEVIRFRLEHEYGARCSFSHLPYVKACWITTTDKKELERFIARKSGAIAYDKEDNPVFLAESDWMLKLAAEGFPSLTFHRTSDFKTGGSK